MASRSSFRVTVDLSKYHEDVRRSSCIFVDSAQCWIIGHVKKHIENTFDIQEPFDLLLNGMVYLPPNEDVRVLKDNEIIVVVPGLGLNVPKAFGSSMRSPVTPNDCVEPEDLKLTAPVNIDGQNDKHTDSSVADISNVESTNYHSESEVAEIESAADLKGTRDHSSEIGRACTEHVSEHSLRKRKRTRRKRSKKETESSLTENIDNKQQTNHCKPKILQSYVLPSSKHIWFDNVDTKKVEVIENHEDDLSSIPPKFYASSLPVLNKSKAVNLSTLLALRDCSSPLTFESKKVNPRTNNASVNEKCTRNDHATEFSNSSLHIQGIKNVQMFNGSSDVAKRIEDYSHLNFDKYPVLQSTPELNDIIAFKILRIGNDYSPEISDYIVAKTRIWCAKTLLYTFEILKGQEQIQTPMGKFTLPENDANNQDIDTASFNFSQLIDPRLIHRQ